MCTAQPVNMEVGSAFHHTTCKVGKGFTNINTHMLGKGSTHYSHAGIGAHPHGGFIGRRSIAVHLSRLLILWLLILVL